MRTLVVTFDIGNGRRSVRKTIPDEVVDLDVGLAARLLAREKIELAPVVEFLVDELAYPLVVTCQVGSEAVGHRLRARPVARRPELPPVGAVVSVSVDAGDGLLIDEVPAVFFPVAGIAGESWIVHSRTPRRLRDVEIFGWRPLTIAGFHLDVGRMQSQAAGVVIENLRAELEDVLRVELDDVVGP